MNKTILTIPTYWTWPAGEQGYPDDGIFDHPTPLDSEGTLGRTLESLKYLKSDSFEVLVITATVNSLLNDAVEKRVEELITPYKKEYPITQFSHSDLLLVRKYLENKRIDPSLINLNEYATIRNCQLIGSMLLGADLIAAIDDDEVVPEDFLFKANDFAGTIRHNKRIDGIGGVYLDKKGDYRVKEPYDARTASNLFRKKLALMNDEFARYMDYSERIVESAIALGGNMIFTKELFMNVPFDPGITRGEDIDYLMNSRLFGYNWFFDRELSITHLPPKPSDFQKVQMSSYSKLQQDVIRFMYQREKLAHSQHSPDLIPLNAEDFGYYPGAFLKDDLDMHALAALTDLRPPGLSETFFPKAEILIEKAKDRAGMVDDFFTFVTEWKKIMEVLSESKELKEKMRSKL